jgi:gp16 family phage-associated protein
MVRFAPHNSFTLNQQPHTQTPEHAAMKHLRTPEEARAELKRKGVSITKWAASYGFTPNLVYEVLAGKRACNHGQSHQIAVALGIKAGEICTDPARALDRRQRVAA